MSGAKPLQGIRVLTLEQFGAGPYGTMFLAELGAEVIKVEAPDGGDPSRQVGPHRLGTSDSEYFQAWNLGKKSVTLDIKSVEGRRQFETLVKGADCVVNNLRGTQPARLGIDYASLKHLKPEIVCLHISAYGRAGLPSRPGARQPLRARHRHGLLGAASAEGQPARHRQSPAHRRRAAGPGRLLPAGC